MGQPGRTRGGSGQGITGLAAAIAAALAAALVWALVAAGCAATTGTDPAEAGEAARAWLRAAPAPEGAVVVRLAFDAAVDLDLYVTGPRRETVYFANTPTKIGGRLDADRRCDAPAPRIETVVFPDPWPGPYRVGVDFPEACGDGGGAAGFAVEVRSAAGRVERTGALRPGEFEPIVLEWDEPAGASPAD